eukprot:4428714-Prorocentrum_lima.AAC.1
MPPETRTLIYSCPELDDTICCSGNATALEELLHLIQLIGQLFGVLLNKTKCELLRLGTASE